MPNNSKDDLWDLAFSNVGRQGGRRSRRSDVSRAIQTISGIKPTDPRSNKTGGAWQSINTRDVVNPLTGRLWVLKKLPSAAAPCLPLASKARRRTARRQSTPKTLRLRASSSTPQAPSPAPTNPGGHTLNSGQLRASKELLPAAPYPPLTKALWKTCGHHSTLPTLHPVKFPDAAHIRCLAPTRYGS